MEVRVYGVYLYFLLNFMANLKIYLVGKGNSLKIIQGVITKKKMNCVMDSYKALIVYPVLVDRKRIRRSNGKMRDFAVRQDLGSNSHSASF